MGNIAACAFDACEADHIRVKYFPGSTRLPDAAVRSGSVGRRRPGRRAWPGAVSRDIGASGRATPSQVWPCRIHLAAALRLVSLHCAPRKRASAGALHRTRAVAGAPQGRTLRVPEAENRKELRGQPIGAGVAEWQTRQTQNLLPATEWGFKSLHPHQFLQRDREKTGPMAGCESPRSEIYP
jgi:hypothetical protein